MKRLRILLLTSNLRFFSVYFDCNKKIKTLFNNPLCKKLFIFVEVILVVCEIKFLTIKSNIISLETELSLKAIDRV